MLCVILLGFTAIYMDHYVKGISYSSELLHYKDNFASMVSDFLTWKYHFVSDASWEINVHQIWPCVCLCLRLSCLFLLSVESFCFVFVYL